MIRATEIRQIAAKQNIRPDVIEKDYVLSWVIAALNHHDISNQWIFKGGTALKKCYFKEYRFSEDLDYSVAKEEDLTEAKLSEIVNFIVPYFG
jgi:predicted nucleotidyltransferase component of viral defense system